jgi:hypothetical protein
VLRAVRSRWRYVPQPLHGFDERHSEQMHCKIDGAAATATLVRIEPSASGRQDLEISALREQVPPSALGSLARHVGAVWLEMDREPAQYLIAWHSSELLEHRFIERPAVPHAREVPSRGCPRAGRNIGAVSFSLLSAVLRAETAHGGPHRARERRRTLENDVMEKSGSSAVDRYLTNAEAAAVLKLSPRTLEKLRVNGGGPRFRKFGSRVIYAREDLDAWANARICESTSDAQYAALR